jgi:invasion protein IalB
MTSWRLAAIAGIALITAAGAGFYFDLIGDTGNLAPMTQLPPKETPPPAVGGSSPLVLSQPAPPVPQLLPETFGNWQVHCVLDLRSRETCRAEQILPGADGQIRLAVVIRSPAAQNPARLSVIPPWGILISVGIAAKVDALPAFEMPVVLCLPAGCRADADLSDALFRALQAGTNLHFVMIAADGQVMTETLPLSGFDQAWRRMAEGPVR